MMYEPVYKCQLCGTMHVPVVATDIPEGKVADLCMDVVRNQNFMHNPALYQAPMYLVCNCGNGDRGLARFVGFRRVRGCSE